MLHQLLKPRSAHRCRVAAKFEFRKKAGHATPLAVLDALRSPREPRHAQPAALEIVEYSLASQGTEHRVQVAYCARQTRGPDSIDFHNVVGGIARKGLRHRHLLKAHPRPNRLGDAEPLIGLETIELMQASHRRSARDSGGSPSKCRDVQTLLPCTRRSNNNEHIRNDFGEDTALFEAGD